VYSDALQFLPKDTHQAFHFVIRALEAHHKLNQMRLENELDVLKEWSEKGLDVLKERSQKELDVLKERSQKELDVLKERKERCEKELDVLKERSEKELRVAQKELDVLKERIQKELDVFKERSRKELDMLKERTGKEIAPVKCELQHEGLERDRVQGVLSLRSAVERVEGACNHDFGSSKQRGQKWLHFLSDTPNGEVLFADISTECSPHINLTVSQVAELVQRLYKLLSEQVHKTGGQLIGGKIYFCAPSWVTQDQKCFLRAIVREAYGKEAVIASDR
jgi:hypothetical protein